MANGQMIMKAMSQQSQSDLCCREGPAATSPKLDILAMDPDEELQEEWEAEDAVKGGLLDPHEVKNAREKETKYLWYMEVYEFSTEAEARARTGRKPVGFKWIDTNNGSAEAPRYRSRVVCTEVRHKGVEPIFSATPPLETLQVQISVACQEDVFRVEDRFLITTADVSRAHFYADAVRDVDVRWPDEDLQAKQPGVCGKLRRTIYGSLDAVQRWREHNAHVLEAGGLSRGFSVPFLPQRLANLHSGAWC